MAAASNEYIPDALTYQDLERIKYSQNLRSGDASQYDSLINQRVNTLASEIMDRKTATFAKASIDLARYMDMEHNANYYKVRSGDVSRLVTSMNRNNSGIENSIMRDKNLTRRQFEINEWYNYNKLETLFFLQLFFISSLSMAILIFLHKNGTITNALASLLTILLLIIVIGTGLYRYFYTTRTRDPRLWHRRYFGTTDKPAKASKCSAGGDVEIDLNEATGISKGATQCADDAAQRFMSWKDSLGAEMTAYQTDNIPPASMTAGMGGKVCSNLA